ncbi:MAG: hypothetical protein ACJATI_004496, partial [Halioglobus sp.]
MCRVGKLITRCSILLIFIFCQIVLLNAQNSFESGQFKIIYEIESKEGADSIWLKDQTDQYENLTTNTFVHYVFNDSIVVKVVMDSLDKIQY